MFLFYDFTRISRKVFPIIITFEKVFSGIATSADPIFQVSPFLSERQYWGDFCKIPACCNYEGFPMFRFYDFTRIPRKAFPESSFFEKVISRVITDDDPIFKFLHFWVSAISGRISARPTPATITRNSRCSNFTTLREFSEKYFPESSLSRKYFPESPLLMIPFSSFTIFE